jgi:RNA polymerase sigma factor (sigma-70 family)
MTGFSDDRAIWLARNVLPHEPALRAWLVRAGAGGLDVDDVVQETYAVLAGRETVADIRNPRAYCFQTARSVVLMHLRRARVVTIRAVEDLEQLGVASDDPSPERQVSDREELQRLGDAIANLPQPGRAALALRVIEGLSQREVGMRLGMSENAAQKHIAKSIHLLMEMFGRGGKAGAGASEDTSKGTRPRHVRSGDQPRD